MALYISNFLLWFEIASLYQGSKVDVITSYCDEYLGKASISGPGWRTWRFLLPLCVQIMMHLTALWTPATGLIELNRTVKGSKFALYSQFYNEEIILPFKIIYAFTF